MRRKTPVRALLEGLAAGVVGTAVQSLFFRATARITPKTPKGAFEPPEAQQESENALETVARRAVEGMAQRGPLDKRQKARLANVAQYGFGAAWGGLYGLLRASYPRVWGRAGVTGLALGVWLIGDNLALPALRLAGWPHHYPWRLHVYAAAAHVAYAGGVAWALAAFDHAPLVPVVAGFASTRIGRYARRLERAGEHALVPRELVAAPRHFAQALARRARDLSR